MIRVAPFALVIGGLIVVAAAAGFCFQIPAVVGLWPWPDSRLSYLFIGSILAAVSAAMLWIGLSAELGALPAGSLNVFVIAIGAGAFFLEQGIVAGRSNLLPFGFVCVLFMLASGAAFTWSRRIPLRDGRPAPRLIQLSFGLFVIALLAAGTALIFRLSIFPWPLNPDSSVVFGCIFLGDACYFAYGLLAPRWHNAKGQLLSFLSYDLVLIGPFLGLLGTIKSEFMRSLVAYLAVLIYSAAIAAYFLFVHSSTRAWQAPSS